MDATIGKSLLTPEEIPAKPKEPWRETLESLWRNPSSAAGIVILSFLVLVAIFAPLLATHDPNKVLFDVPEEGAKPRLEPCIHLLGCPQPGDELLTVNSDENITSGGLSLRDTMLQVSVGNTVQIWSTGDQSQIANLVSPNPDPITATDWHPNEQRLASASGEEILIWEMNRQQLGRTLANAGGAEFLEWNADGSRFFSIQGNLVTLWDATLWSRVGAPIELPTEPVGYGWNTNGTLLMTAAGTDINIWNAFTATSIATLSHPEPITDAVYDSRGTRILSSSGTTLTLWGSDNTQQGTFSHTVPLNQVGWNENVAQGTFQVMASSGATALVWNVADGALLYELDHGEPITYLDGSPLATRIITVGASQIRVWDAGTGELVLTVPLNEPALSVQWIGDGSGVLVTDSSASRMIKTTNYQYIMGTDGNARDEYSRLVFGARVSLVAGFSVVSAAILLGTVLGALAGFWGGWYDNILMRIMDVLLAFPALILAIAIVTFLGPGLTNALIGLTIVSIPGYARLARAGVLSTRDQDFVAADRALGVHPMRILFRRILPNTLAPIIVQGTLGIGGVILEAAALSFIGLGAQPPTAEWGAMLASERAQVFTSPHLVFLPGIAIWLTVLAFNLIGDGLRDALDPRLNR